MTMHDESELRRFAALQERLAPMVRRVFPEPLEPRTVVVLPSLSMDRGVLEKITGVQHYEERLLCMLMLLRLPRTHLIYLTSVPVDPTIIGYYLHLLPGIPGSHARRRLTLLTCRDATPVPLAEKILKRPRLVRRIRRSIPDIRSAHMTCFNVTPLERRLALELGIPIYGCDPVVADCGSKSGSREAFKAAGIDLPDGFERLRDAGDVFDAVAELKNRHPDLRRAVVKLEEGTSGEGNAVFDFGECPTGPETAIWVRRELPKRILFEASEETWEEFMAKYEAMGGIVESWVEGEPKRSPSVQCRIDPLGSIEMISTHDQILGGPSGQVFKGCTFPADAEYRMEIQEDGLRVAKVLRDHAVIGRFGIDFVSVKEADGWRHYAIEINLRKGGTTHTYMMLQYLTDGTFDPETGLYTTPTGRERYYYATDNLYNEAYRGLLPDDLIDIAVENSLHFHGATQQGVVFHLIGALSEFGKLGMVCVGASAGKARQLYDETVDVLDQEAVKPAETKGGYDPQRAERRLGQRIQTRFRVAPGR